MTSLCRCSNSKHIGLSYQWNVHYPANSVFHMSPVLQILVFIMTICAWWIYTSLSQVWILLYVILIILYVVVPTLFTQQAVEWPVTLWDYITSMWRHRNVARKPSFTMFQRTRRCTLGKDTSQPPNLYEWTSEDEERILFHRHIHLLLVKIYNFGKYVRLSGCLSVCVSVRFVKRNSWTLWHIITKLDPYMYWVTCSCKLHGQICRSQN